MSIRTGGSGSLGNSLFRQIRKGAWRGIILVYPYSPKVVEALARKTTVVSTMEDYDNLSIDSIDTSHQAGIVRMVEKQRSPSDTGESASLPGPIHCLGIGARRGLPPM